VFIYTASALTIIRLFRERGKVRCHMRPVDFAFGSRFSQKRPEVGTHPYVELPSPDLPLPNLE
jgi:hypothetical protein